MKLLKRLLALLCAVAVLSAGLSCSPKEEVPVPVSSVSISPPSLSIAVGETSRLSATVLPADAANPQVTWSAAHPHIADVSEDGMVTAVSPGNAIIRATADGVSAQATVEVYVPVVPVSGIELEDEEITLTEGMSITLRATVLPADATDKTVTWSSSNTYVAAVDQNGKVTANAEGLAFVKASAQGKEATCAIIVKKKTIAVSRVSLNWERYTLTKGKTLVLEATVYPSNATDKTVTWSSSDETVASVDQRGKVIALEVGKAVITATAGDCSATCSLKVESDIVVAVSVTLNKNSLTLAEGESETLVATVRPSNTTDKTVVWSSSDETVATVDQNGKVTGLVRGSAVITATSGDVSGECAVTVAPNSFSGGGDPEGFEEENGNW